MKNQATNPQGASRHTGGFLDGALILILLAVLAGIILFGGWVFQQRVERIYQGHIYPNVYALGVELSALTPAEAATALEETAARVAIGRLILTDGERQWAYPWTEAGMYLDAQMMAQIAYNMGREGTWLDRMSVWTQYHDVEPRFAFDEEVARGMLAALSAEASQPPVEPVLSLDSGDVVVTPGTPGRVLNVPATLARMRAVAGSVAQVEIALVFDAVAPAEPDIAAIRAQVDALLARAIRVTTYDVLTRESLSWELGRDEIGVWLHLIPGPEGTAEVDVNLYAIRDTLQAMAAGLGDGRGFHFDEAAREILAVFDAGGGEVTLYLSHPERVHSVRAGETLTSIAAQHGMPPGLVAEANANIDINRLFVGDQITIPSQDVLTPYIPVPGKRVVVNIAEQRMRVYEGGNLLHEWPVSTGKADSPTHRGVFQVIRKTELAYASQWNLQMPYFITIYPAGGYVDNGIHELPILAGGQRLWEGNLGHPASFGCIILGIPAAETLYHWADIGVLVVVE